MSPLACSATNSTLMAQLVPCCSLLRSHWGVTRPTRALHVSLVTPILYGTSFLRRFQFFGHRSAANTPNSNFVRSLRSRCVVTPVSWANFSLKNHYSACPRPPSGPVAAFSRACIVSELPWIDLGCCRHGSHHLLGGQAM
jgi:hypothetical protein